MTLKMKKGMKDNMDRKRPSINNVVKHNGVPLFSFVELNINEICNRTCPFCPRANPKQYPNQNIHMDIQNIVFPLVWSLLKTGFLKNPHKEEM